MKNLVPMTRPILEVAKFNQALASSFLSQEEESIIDYVRYTGVFDELKMRLIDKNSKPGKYKNNPQFTRVLLTIVIKLTMSKQIPSIKTADINSLVIIRYYSLFQNCNFVYLIDS